MAFVLNEVCAGEKTEGRAFQAGERSRAETLQRVLTAWWTQGQKGGPCSRAEPAQGEQLKSESRQRPGHGGIYKIQDLDFIPSTWRGFKQGSDMPWFTFLKANFDSSLFPSLGEYNTCCIWLWDPSHLALTSGTLLHLRRTMERSFWGQTAFQKSHWAWRRQEQKFHSPWCLVSDDTCNSRGLQLVAELRTWMKDDPTPCLPLKTLCPASVSLRRAVKLRAMCSPFLVSRYFLL